MELRDLSTVLAADGPFVTVHVESESDVEQAADKYDLEWKNILRELEGRGVDSATLTAVAAAKGEHSSGASRLVVAAQGEVQLAVSLPTVPSRPVVDVAPLPHLLPLVDDVSTRVPHVVVIADRTGADVSAYYDAERVAGEVTVTGHAPDIRKVPVGGWSNLRYQHRAENGWEANAREIVAAVNELAQRIGAALVIGVGDLRALALVKEHLAQPLQERWVEVEGGRSQDGSADLVRQRIRDALSLHVATQTLDLLAEYAQERGQLKRACEGVADVVAALRKAQVQTLLITTAADREGTLWFGPEPAAVSETAQELRDLGVETPQEGPLVDVLLRAALGTGADVQLVPHETPEAPNGGVGAVLRYADDDNAAARA